jgi:hypothetical protein
LLPHASHPLAGPILALSSTLAGNLLIVAAAWLALRAPSP